MNEQYLLKRGNCWHLNYRLPARFGNKIIRCTLKTSDAKLAREIRDRFIKPISYADGAINALEEIVKHINTLEIETQEHIANLKNVVLRQEELNIEQAVNKFFKFIDQSTLRPSTKKDYPIAIIKVFELLPKGRLINSLTKKDAIIVRDDMLKNELSATRLDFCMKTFRQFLRWCENEGIARKGIVENFVIPLPTVEKEHTHDIPKELADQAASCVPEWTLPPRIARYTGMRLQEVLNLTTADIVEFHGIYCFTLKEGMTKTKTARLVPIAEKLKSYVIGQSLAELKLKGHKNDRYNEYIKKIPGLERCKFHSWRVYANTRMMESGVDKAVRMRILGHKASKSDIHTGYTSVQITDMKKAVDLIF